MTVLYLGIILGVILLIYMRKEAGSNRVLYHEVQLESFPKSFGEVRIFFISDIHRRIISEKIIYEVNGKIDLVIIGGDLIEKGVPFNRVKANILKLKKVGPVYFVWGNNDYEVDSHLLDATLLDLGVKILDNTTVAFESAEGEHFLLMGIDDLSKDRDRLDLAIQDIKEDGFRLLVSHNPEITKKLLPEYKIDFILSGHTHGGQIRLFGFGPYQIGGMKKLEHSMILTSNGYGTTSLPLRLSAKSETHVITLKHGDDQITLPKVIDL